jgi:hypothetical protein
LASVTHKAGYVDPYRLASLAFTNRPKPEVAAVLPLFLQ